MLTVSALLFSSVLAINPIVIQGNRFFDSATGDPFLVRGVDYQPGGSSGYHGGADPLSDADTCARDAYLFQSLGLNSVRVYSVNPALDHDQCMTILAHAGIYVILDVNSPQPGESLNRYEPWTTYNPNYLQHVFEVVEEFSGYNNTMGYFIGNEVVNDERSASVSPIYVRAVARDVKDYIYFNSPRYIPVGYSAADDLKYRIPLAHYLSCGDDESAVDFYGVNSYQWCGHQTFKTSGYDVLVRDHEEFTMPLFLSEFGCNLVQPRLFEEIEPLYSPRMTHVFSGGLVYEFTQEANNYGIVDVDDNGNVKIRPDFDTLKQMLSGTPSDTDAVGKHLVPPHKIQQTNRPLCKTGTDHFGNHEIPESFGTDMIRYGVRIKRGQLLENYAVPETTRKIFGPDGLEITNKTVKYSEPPRPRPGYVANFTSPWTRHAKALSSAKPKQRDDNDKSKANTDEEAFDTSDASWTYDNYMVPIYIAIALSLVTACLYI